MRWYTSGSGKREREGVSVCRQTPDSDPVPHLQGINKHVCVSAPVDYNQREKGIKFILQLSLIFQGRYCCPCERA